MTGIADGAITETNVTDIYLPDTEQPLTIGTGALPGTATIHTTLALLDDYALMTTLQQNYEAAKRDDHRDTREQVLDAGYGLRRHPARNAERLHRDGQQRDAGEHDCHQRIRPDHRPGACREG